MKREKGYSLIILMLFLLSLVGISGCGQNAAVQQEEEYYMKLAATSSQMTCLAVAVAGDKVLVRGPIIPPTVCPGHFDIKPSDLADMKDCDAIFAHSFEPFVEKVVKNIDNPDLKVVKVEVIGAWMEPSKQKEAAGKVLQEMKKLDPDHAQYYEDNTRQYIDKIDRTASELQAELKEHASSKGKVICQLYQKGLLEWMGFEVLGTYEFADSLTPEKVKELIDSGRDNGVTMVIDHMQSAPGAGKEIADSIGAQNFSLSFFPGGMGEGNDYFAELEANVDATLQIWDQQRKQND